MADTSYDADFGIPISFTFTPDTGTPFGTEQAQAQELTPADVQIETAKYTPISGPNAFIEDFAMGKYPVTTMMVKATYSAAEHNAAAACQEARVRGDLSVTYADGMNEVYDAALTGIRPSPIDAQNLRTDDLTFTVRVPPQRTGP